MAEFKAVPDEMRDISVRLSNAQRRLDEVTQSLRGTIRGIEGNPSLHKLGYGHMVREASARVEKTSKTVAKHTRTLEQVADLYESYERRVMGAPFGSTEGVGGAGSKNPFWEFLKGDAKLAGAILGGEISGKGDFLGVSASGAVSGELLGGEVSLKPEAAFDLSKGNAYVGVKGKAAGHVAKGKAEGDWGLLHGEGEAAVISGAVEGELAASLFRDGRLDPSLKAAASAKASVLSGKSEARFGEEGNNVHVGAKGDVLTAHAGAEASFGKDGFGAKVEAGAYAAEGEVSGGIEFMGVKVDLIAKGKAGGAGIEAGFGASKGVIEGNLGAGLGLGAGVGFKVDFSGVPKAFGNWWDNLTGKKR